jgi:hypothetical protein
LVQIETLIAASNHANRATWEDNVATIDAVSNSHLTFKMASVELRREMVKNLVSNSQVCDGKVTLTMGP